MEQSLDAVELLPVVGLDFSLPVNNEPQRHGLNATRREFWLHLSPEYR